MTLQHLQVVPLPTGRFGLKSLSRQYFAYHYSTASAAQRAGEMIEQDWSPLVEAVNFNFDSPCSPAREESERLLYPPKIISFNKADGGVWPSLPVEKDNPAYQIVVRRHKPGDIVRAYASAPGTGFIDSRITRIDEHGVWGVTVRDTIRELSPHEVI